MFPPRWLVPILVALLVGEFAAAQTVVNSTWVDRVPQPNLLVYSDPSNWSPAVVPNNTATTHYNVTIGARFIIGVDVDATISNLNLEGSVPGVNVTGRNFTVIGETTSALPTAIIRVGSTSNAAARFNAGWLSTFSNGTLSGHYSVDSSGYPATLQFNGANISTLANGDVILQGPLARIEDEGGNDALRNLARIDSTASLWLGYNATVSTNALFRNDGTLNIASSGGGSLTAAAGLTNFDSTSRTITGGIFDLTGSSLRFYGADIVTIASSIHLYGTARIEDLAGNDGLRNLKHILPSGQFSLTKQSRAIASQFQNDGLLSLSEDSVFNVAGLSNFDSSARTLSGGTFVLSRHSQLQFADADIVHNGASIMLSLGGAIKDLTGADGLRNFNDNLASGEFVVGNALQFSPPGAFTNAGVVKTARAYFDRGSFVPEGRLIVPAGFSYTQTSGSTVNDGYLAADRVDILGGTFSGLGTVKGNVTIKNATVSPSASMVFQGDLTLNSDAHFHYQFSFNEPQQITGKVTLAGILEVDIPSEAFVSSTAVLTVLKSASPIIGAFSNAPNGARISTVDGRGSVVVIYDTKAVYITGYQADPPPAQLLNISSRAFLSRSDDDPFSDRAVIIGGFIITGTTEPKDVVLRGLGPSLTQSGLAPVLADPILELHASDGALLATNDNWKDTQANQIAATGLAPSDDREAALRVTLQPGTYTVVIKEKNGLAGNGLVEIYDFSQTSNSKLANISTRGFTDSTNLLIGGMIAGGAGQANAEMVVRALGPQLRRNGIFNALEDPTLELRDSNGSVVAFNDDWITNSTQFFEYSELTPHNTTESAMRLSLPRGNYTAIVRAKGNSGGVALVEFYDLRR